MVGESKNWTLTVIDEVKAPIDKVWELTSDFVGLERWVPYLQSTLVSGQRGEVGVMRRAGRADGGSYAIEQLVSLDNEKHYYKYRLLETDLKLKDYESEFQLTPGSEPGTTVITWSYEMVPYSETTEETVAAQVGTYFRFGIENVKKMLTGVEAEGK